MYAALWRALPGPVWVKAIIAALLVAAVLAALILWVFPFVQTLTTPADVTVQNP